MKKVVQLLLSTLFVFTANEFTGELIDSDEGNLKWIDNDKLLDLNLWEGDPIFMDWIYNQDRYFSAKFSYLNKKLESHSVIFY